MANFNSNILSSNKLDRDSVDAAMGYTGDNIGNLTIEQTRRLVASLAKTESFGGNIHAEELNASGHVGMYQVSPNFLVDAGFMNGNRVKELSKNETYKEILEDDSAWNPGYSLNKYKNSRELQDKSFSNYHNKHYKELLKRGAIKADSSPSHIMGVIKAYHLKPSEAIHFSITGEDNGKGDANGTKVSKYYNDITKDNDGLNGAMNIANFFWF